MSDLGRILIFLGLLLLVVGVVVVVLGRLNLPIGPLPGDFSWRGRGWSVNFPLASSILLSVILSLIFWAINHFRR
ncbi:MAG TPA: DUF2905 domain-containing protein [Edaphobacter sp.]